MPSKKRYELHVRILEAQFTELTRLATEQSTNISELIRNIVNEHLSQSSPSVRSPSKRCHHYMSEQEKVEFDEWKAQAVVQDSTFSEVLAPTVTDSTISHIPEPVLGAIDEFMDW